MGYGSLDDIDLSDGLWEHLTRDLLSKNQPGPGPHAIPPPPRVVSAGISVHVLFPSNQGSCPRAIHTLPGAVQTSAARSLKAPQPQQHKARPTRNRPELQTAETWLLDQLPIGMSEPAYSHPKAVRSTNVVTLQSSSSHIIRTKQSTET